MEINKMEGFINNRRAEFRAFLIMEEVSSKRTDHFKDWLKDSLDECCSKFEEDTLIENLAEEYKLYLEELAA